MNDRELLELAAKSAGITNYQHAASSKALLIAGDGCEYYWDPLNDDGDALRLAVKLELQLRLRHSENVVRVYGGPQGAVDEGVRGDPAVATRRAIVRAAAAISEGLAPFPSADEIRENWT